MNFIITYLIVGGVVSFLVDLLLDGLINKGMIPPELRKSWGNTQRILVICLWPYAIVKFIEAFIK